MIKSRWASFLLGTAIIGLLSFETNAAQVSPSPGKVTSSATVATTGSVQTLFADNVYRFDCFFQNEEASGGATMAVTTNGDTPAVGGLGYQVAPGNSLNCNNGTVTDTGPIKVIGTTGKSFYATETNARGQ